MIKRLKECRTEKGLTQKGLATQLNTTQQTYSDYETGRTEPDSETLIKIADILAISIDYLLGRSDDFGNISVQTEGIQLTNEEEGLLNNFRTLPRPERAQTLEYVQFLASKRGNKNKHA